MELYGNLSEVEVIASTQTIKKISSISFNQPQQLLYFVSNENHRSSKIFVYNGVESKNLYFGFGIKHIAIDWITSNIYYAADGKNFLGMREYHIGCFFCYHISNDLLS